MSKVRVSAFSISLDGFGAAPGQSLENPFGVGGLPVVDWFAATQTFHDHVGKPGKGSTGTDDAVAAAALKGIGAWIKARAAAGDKDVRIGGGAATIRQYLEAKLIDLLHLAVAPVLLGAGESPINGLNLPALGYEVADKKLGENAMHVFLRKR